MANIKEKIAIQKKSSIEDWYKIILFKEGNFFRVYNEGAFQLTTFLYTEEYAKSINEKQGLKIIKSEAKDTGDYIISGFPINSSEKFLKKSQPSYKEGSDYFVIELDKNLIPEQYRKAELLQKAYETTFDKIPKTPKNEPKEPKYQKQVRKYTVFDLMKDIEAFDIACSTPIEALTFLSDIKKRLKEMFL